MDDTLKTIKPRSVKKTSPEQFELLRSEMATHTAAALGYGSSRDRTVVDAEWKDIMEKLNAIGPPYRTLAEWKKVWSDVRLRSKKMMCEEFQRKYKSESEEELLIETLNSANTFYNSHNSSDQEFLSTRNDNEEEIRIPNTDTTNGSTLSTNRENLKKSQHHNNNRKKKTTKEQFRLLKQEMAKHPLAARGYGTGKYRYKVDAEWNEILVKLNKLGPPYRNMTEWKKVWSDVRLRVRKSMGKPPRPLPKHKLIKKESETDSDDFMQALNETCSMYNEGNVEFSKNLDEKLSTSLIPENASEPYVPNEPNPLDDVEPHENNDETTSYNHDYQVSDIDETHSNDTTEDMPQSSKDNFMEHTLNTLQMQAEQHDQILQHLTQVTKNMKNVMENQVKAMELRNHLMTEQSKANGFYSYMQRRHELRRNNRSKIVDWF